MSLLGPTLVLYVLVGIAIAVALYLSDPPRPAGERLLRLSTAVPFWPFYLPILLARPTPAVSSDDEWTRTLAAVQPELDAALSSLDEWIGIPEEQQRRIDGLREAWTAQAERLREMDRLLARPEYADADKEDGPGASPRLRQTLAARQQNLQRLRQLRQQIDADLLASLVGVRELVSRIYLARFTDAPAARAEEFLAELAAAVDMLTAPHGPREQAHAFKKAE